MSFALHAHEASEPQKMRAVGFSSGLSSREPAGTTTVLPLRLMRGTGLPQQRQNHLAKLKAEGKSK
jgi:hypothetical protein